MAHLASLRAIRERQSLSLTDLAARSDVAKGTIYRLEHGAPKPHPVTVRKLAAALGVEPHELRGIEPHEAPAPRAPAE